MRPLFERCSILSAAIVCTTGVPAVTVYKQNGWARDAANKVYVTTATPVPATAIMHQGLAFSPAGQLYVTNSAVGLTGITVQGFAIRSDGALYVNSAAATTTNMAGVGLVGGRLHETGL